MPLQPTVLSPFSQYFWIREQVSSNAIFFWAEVEGLIREPQLHTAIQCLEARYPLLHAKVVKAKGQMPYFVEGQSRIEVSEVEAREKGALEAAIRRESLRGSADSLFRIVLLRHSPETSTLLLVMSHAVSDAQGAAMIMRDLLTALSGVKLEPSSSAIVTHEDVLGQPKLQAYVQTLQDERALDHELEQRQRALQVAVQSMSVPEVEALVRRARRENTTVQAALMAAVVRVARTLHEPWNSEQSLNILVPMDLRRFWKGTETANLLARPVFTAVSDSEELDFWSFARLCKANLDAGITLEESQAFVQKAHALMGIEWDPQSFFEATNHATPHQLFVSNLGRVRIPEQYGHMRLHNVGFCHSSAPDVTQSICVATLNGAMSLSQTSQRPIAGLLQGIRQLLLTQSL